MRKVWPLGEGGEAVVDNANSNFLFSFQDTVFHLCLTIRCILLFIILLTNNVWGFMLLLMSSVFLYWL